MHYRIKRLTNEIDQTPTGYNLLSESGNLLLAADISTTKEGEKTFRQVRFARPDGTMLATMKLPAGEATMPGPVMGRDFVVVQDYAVYAILTPRQDEDDTVMISLEAEGGNWLIKPRPPLAGSYALHGQLPEGVHMLTRQEEAEMPPEVGQVLPAEAEADYHYLVELVARRWRQTSLVVLALIFLLDSLPQLPAVDDNP